jgi:hypothetical protein
LASASASATDAFTRKHSLSVSVPWLQEVHSVAFFTKPRGSANPVNIVFSSSWEIVVDDVLNIVHVNPTAC